MDRTTFLNQLHQRFQLPASLLNDLVERTTGCPIADVQRLVRGDENEVYRVTLGSGDSVFLRAAFPGCPPAKMSREAIAMGRAREAGVPVPDVLVVETLATEQGDRQTMLLGEAAGSQLTELLPGLSESERTTVMQNLGRLLGRLETVRLPGYGRPDEHDHWPDPKKDRSRYLAAVRRDSRQLDRVGLTNIEVEEIGRILDSRTALEIADAPILTHGDISEEHLFVDGDQSLTALIDWGMWSGGSTADELAALSMTLDDGDFATVLASHPTAGHNISAFRPKIAMSVLTRSIGQLAWLIRSGQSDHRQRMTKALRQAVNELQSAE